MSNESQVNSFIDEFVQLFIVVERSLVNFEDQNFISEVEEHNGDGTDNVEQWNDATESQGNDDY